MAPHSGIGDGRGGSFIEKAKRDTLLTGDDDLLEFDQGLAQEV
jgi:hypothetical protein